MATPIDEIWGQTPFYSEYANQPIPGKIQEAKKTSRSNEPSQKTLDDWHYRLNNIILDIQGDFDRNSMITDIENIKNDIESYLRG